MTLTLVTFNTTKIYTLLALVLHEANKYKRSIKYLYCMVLYVFNRLYLFMKLER